MSRSTTDPSSELSSKKPTISQKMLAPRSAITAKDPTRTIITDSIIPYRTKFGPFPGKNAVQSEFNNWMQCVTGVRSLDEANLVPMIYEKELYFSSINSIYPGEELLVWTGATKNHLIIDQWLANQIQRAEFKTTFFCQECDSVFSSSAGVYVHWLRKHCRDKRQISPMQLYKCPYCPRTITRRYNLRVHIRKIHMRIKRPPVIPVTTRKGSKSDEDRPVTCEICERRFKLAAHLATHVKHCHRPKIVIKGKKKKVYFKCL